MNEASQMPKIERAPRVLIVQLKRFASKWTSMTYVDNEFS